jgi:glucose-6-phosphate 1-epimerase
MDPFTSSASSLDQQHGIPGVARVLDGRGGLPKVQVTTPAASGEIYLLGGQVTSWVPAGHADVLFVSAASRFEAGRSIRGGIPVCFPWFANKADDPQAPAHGFVRSAAWRLDSIAQRDGAPVVTVVAESSEQTRALWPFGFRATLRAAFGSTLRVEFAVTNTGTTPLTFEEALHTYYGVGDITTVRVTGLDRVRYRDKVAAGLERLQDGDITFIGETDRVYLDTTGAVDILDPSRGRRIRVEKTQSRATVVWNPWIDRARAMSDLLDDDWTRMVCVETCNVEPSAIVLRPGEEHAVSMTVSVSAL